MKASATAFFHILRQRGLQQMNCLLARVCIGCGTKSQTIICEACWQTLQVPKYQCDTCGIALPAEMDTRQCVNCIKKPPSYEHLAYVANYEGLIADCIVSAKIGRQATAVEAIRYLIKRYLSTVELGWYKGYTILPMPIPQFRLMQRGFNLPLLMAQQLSALTDLPIVPSFVVLLPRVSQKQATLSKKQRGKRQNSITIKGELPQRLLIVDDVVTTGGTINALSTALRNHGVQHIAVWSLARTQWQ